MGLQSSKPNTEITESLKADPDLSANSFPRTTGSTITIDGNPPRKVGFAVYGAVDAPKERTLLFFHGTPGTRFFFTREHTEYAKSENFRVVVPERPGFGLSDELQGRLIMDGAEDAKRVLEGLGIEGRVYVLGYSAGGPYALGFMRRFREYCYGGGIVSGVGPNGRGVMRGMSLVSKVGWVIAGNWGGGVRMGVKAMVEGKKKEVLEGRIGAFSKKENDFFGNNEGVRRCFLESVFELYGRETGVRAEAEDYVLMAADWGFEIEDIEGKVWLYGGEMDDKCGVGMFRELERRLKEGKAELVVRFEDEEDHLMFYRVFEEVVQDLGLTKNVKTLMEK